LGVCHAKVGQKPNAAWNAAVSLMLAAEENCASIAGALECALSRIHQVGMRFIEDRAAEAALLEWGRQG
jgi:hypothetical protein